MVSSPEDLALESGYEKPDYCNCVFAINRDNNPCGVCGAVTEFIYWSLCGFPITNPMCPECHDDIDDCEPTWITGEET